jgi:hypothetical protein
MLFSIKQKNSALSEKVLWIYSFVFLCVLLCEPLWLNHLLITTKEHEGYH